MNNLISAYGGALINLMVDVEQANALSKEALTMPSIDLDQHQLCDLELLLNGAFSPLTGFMGQGDYRSVENHMHLADGTFWPLPITLDVSEKMAQTLTRGLRVALRDNEGFMLAVLTVSDIWEAGSQLDTQLGGAIYHVGGDLEGISLPLRHDYTALRLSPQEMRNSFIRRGWRRVIAYQARQPLYRAQYEFTLRAAMQNEANLLIHLVTGGEAMDSPEYFARVRSYQAAQARYPAATSALALLPFYPRGEGERAILLRAIVQRNFGCTHLIVGGDYEESGAGRRGADFTQHDVLQRLASHITAIGIELIGFPRMVYVEERDQYMPEEAAPIGARTLTLSGFELRRRLAEGVKIPDWYVFPEIIAEIRKAHPSRDKQGFTVFFTGLSGSGKSTLAKVLTIKLLELGGRRVTLLDGDIVRKHLSSELGFSKAHRDINIRRIGYVASEITKNNGIAICAPIAPYRATRRAVRAMIEQHGGFIEVYVATPLEVCERRDLKGLYAKARAGLVKEFTGISDPYETPEQPAIIIDTTDLSVEEAAQRVLLKLEHEGYLR